MSFGDPNNPYGQPPQQPPSAAPGYGYPQQSPPPPGVPPQQGYGYPQQPAYPGYPGANMMGPQSMPGLLTTARVLLYLVSAAQIFIGLAFLWFAAFVNDVTDAADDLSTSSDDPFSAIGEGGDMAAGVMVFFALIALGLAALSITLGVKFGKGGQGIRITTVIYGALGFIVGAIYLFVGIDTGLASAVIFPLLWVSFAAIITAAPVVPSGTAWFARPRY
ncbi:hypothetical protein SUDANB105_02908 [Streptomyces sp. enrichment culture]|uniref:hypothetical protein n=1 Tax=Streptomyces sp. enrichment culture TaxID=1795815 RepID=UPI003F56E1B0